jgi:hypothetical protein
MRVEQNLWTKSGGWEPMPGGLGDSAQMVFVFGGTALLKEGEGMDALRAAYPQAHILGCSTAGEICGARVYDDTLVATAIHFEHTRADFACESVGSMDNSFSVGRRLGQALIKDDLVHVFVLSDGLKINGSELAQGLTSGMPGHVSITGGLAGDGARFGETYVLWEGKAERNIVTAVGLYGTHLKVGYGSVGGWDPFGPERLVTRSKGNVLYELDGKSVLGLYKTYLGDQARELPASGLLFPLSVRLGKYDRPVVRTILSVDEANQSMTFAGDIPEGAFARLMKANFDRLIDGAVEAANLSCSLFDNTSPDLALLISCVGRKLILKQRIEEEVEGVQEILGPQTPLTGFYSYGELCPFTRGERCELHNQTMTITSFSER